MPNLELTDRGVRWPEELGALTYVGSIMMWPDREEGRRRQEAAAHAAHLEGALSVLLRSGDQSALSDPAGLATLFGYFLRAPPISEVQEETQVRRIHGTAAGLILTKGLNQFYEGRGRGLGPIKEEVRQLLGGAPFHARLSPSTIENTVWGRFRPVAALWAAYLKITTEYHAAKEELGFPCRLCDLPEFLSLAENIRQAAEACPQHRRAEPLLVPGTSWRVPPGVLLPQVHVSWPISYRY